MSEHGFIAEMEARPIEELRDELRAIERQQVELGRLADILRSTLRLREASDEPSDVTA